MKRAPKSLQVWFIFHFVFDYLLGLPLLFAPGWLLSLFGWTVIDNFTARLIGAALIGIGGISLLKHKEVWIVLMIC